jgi:hypothetical protein
MVGLNMITSAIAALFDAALLVEIKQQNSDSPPLRNPCRPVIYAEAWPDEVRHQVCHEPCLPFSRLYILSQFEGAHSRRHQHPVHSSWFASKPAYGLIR